MVAGKNAKDHKKELTKIGTQKMPAKFVSEPTGHVTPLVINLTPLATKSFDYRRVETNRFYDGPSRYRK